MKFRIVLTIILCSFIVDQSFAQDDLLALADKQTKPKNEYTIATFKYTRLINVQTVETLGKRTLDVIISHRFGNINSGGNNLWGLDGPANIRLALEYSYGGRLMVGFGRSSYEKMFDGLLKYRLLRQKVDGSMPISVTWHSSIYCNGQKNSSFQTLGVDKYQYASSRLSYVNQIIIGRKFSSKFSMQLSPVFVHYNLVDNIRDKNDIFAISAAARVKLTKRLAVTSEYTYRVTKDYSSRNYYDSFGVGVDIETGGHVFQMHLTNSFGISDNQFIPYTSSSWSDMGIRIGYNLSRVFTL